MKVSWHGNRKHISARWHTKGLPVLHVAFLRERIQRGFKCYHDLTHKISQLWLTRLPDFYSFMRPHSSCYSLFLPVIWSAASTFLLHTKCILDALSSGQENVNSQDPTKHLKRLVCCCFFWFSTPGCPRLSYHVSSSCRSRWAINWKAGGSPYIFRSIWSQVGNSTGCYCADQIYCHHTHTRTRMYPHVKFSSMKSQQRMQRNL